MIPPSLFWFITIVQEIIWILAIKIQLLVKVNYCSQYYANQWDENDNWKCNILFWLACLKLCSVLTAESVAEGKPSTSSQASGGGGAAVVVDGNVGGPCFSSTQSTGPWWEVDIGRYAYIYEVSIAAQPSDEDYKVQVGETLSNSTACSFVCIFIMQQLYNCLDLTCLTFGFKTSWTNQGLNSWSLLLPHRWKQVRGQTQYSWWRTSVSHVHQQAVASGYQDQHPGRQQSAHPLWSERLLGPGR